MKKLFALTVIIALTISVFAQPPQKMTYQCVVRDKDGMLLMKQLVGMRTTILQGSDIQLVVYQETYNFTATNENGLLTIEIGSGKPTIVSGPFTSIPWSSGPFFLQTEIDPTGGTDYTIIGKSQILSVPYAFYSEKAGTVTETDPVFAASAAKGITWTNFANWNTAYSWGNHYGLYRSVFDIPSWNEITGKPTTVSGYGITNAVTTSGNQTISGDKSFTAITNINNLNVLASMSSNFNTISNVADPVEDHDAATKAYIDNTLKALGLIPDNYSGTVTDIDGNIYKTVNIGTQTWMTENLRVEHYNNGTEIPLITDNTSWGNLRTPGYCYYTNDEATFKASYGALYNWYAVGTGNLCPAGWHIPTDAEWTVLTTHLGGENIAGGKLKETGTIHWASPNTGATNEKSFTALPGGYRNITGEFFLFLYVTWWWSATPWDWDVSCAWARCLEYDNTEVMRKDDRPKWLGYSVRCIKD